VLLSRIIALVTVNFGSATKRLPKQQTNKRPFASIININFDSTLTYFDPYLNGNTLDPFSRYNWNHHRGGLSFFQTGFGQLEGVGEDESCHRSWTVGHTLAIITSKPALHQQASAVKS
jgi:hypothetical protein